MKYSRWLKAQYPHLANEHDVIVQNYIKQAKDDTKKVRLIISLLFFVFVGLLGYAIGYLLGRYSDFDANARFAVILLNAAILIFLLNKVEQRLIKRRLVKLLAS
ncbi:hypothetical protein [Arsukibacterium sp.]|uniref:hypothetical protein n=1 Tax=Arsukibacterium sp. TaxID=1977258 RepID=UPI00299EE5FE|nr:hypothetical protein [Arsukibacterium sp.]MDX1537979.1 hypothetical protein [Arsukibacterium sp.]